MVWVILQDPWLHKPTYLASFPVPSIISLLSIWSDLQLESSLLPPGNVYYHYTLRIIMQYNTLVTVAASGSFLWILGPWKALTYFFFVFYLFAEMLYECITQREVIVCLDHSPTIIVMHSFSLKPWTFWFHNFC